MIHHKIYLVGQISSNPASYEWRLNVQKHLAIQDEKIRETIELLDPCKNSMNLSLIRQAKFDESKFNEAAFNHSSMDILAPLDAGYVKASTIGFINMNHFTPERPIIGSYFELAWYFILYPEKPTIGIFDGDPCAHYHTKHPFVQSSVDTWVKSEIDALNLIIKQCFC